MFIDSDPNCHVKQLSCFPCFDLFIEILPISSWKDFNDVNYFLVDLILGSIFVLKSFHDLKKNQLITDWDCVAKNSYIIIRCVIGKFRIIEAIIPGLAPICPCSILLIQDILFLSFQSLIFQIEIRRFIKILRLPSFNRFFGLNLRLSSIFQNSSHSIRLFVNFIAVSIRNFILRGDPWPWLIWLWN